MKTTDGKETLNGKMLKKNRWINYVNRPYDSDSLSKEIVNFNITTRNFDCVHSFIDMPNFKKFIKLAKENISVGLELETANVGLEKILAGTYTRNHIESGKIMEYEMKPCDIGSVKKVAQYGEYIRICNPFHIKGVYESYSGSAHCHVNVVPFIDKIKKVDCEMEIQTNDYWNPREYYHAYTSADLLANPVILSMITPFTSITYLKSYSTKVPFRDKTALLKNRYDSRGRGYSVMINNGTEYARYGLEYRLNENTNLWVYLIPYFAWKIQHNLIENEDELIAIKDELAMMQGDYTFYGNSVQKNNTFNEKVNILKDMTKMHIDVFEMAWLYDWTEEELEIFKAYIDEDIEKYESLIYTNKLDSIRQQVYKLYENSHCDESILTPDKIAFNDWKLNEATRYEQSNDVFDTQSTDTSARDELLESISNPQVEDIIVRLFDMLDGNNINKVRLLLPMTDDNKLLKEYIKLLVPDVKFVRKNSTFALTSGTVAITDDYYTEYNCNTDNVVAVLTI